VPSSHRRVGRQQGAKVCGQSVNCSFGRAGRSDTTIVMEFKVDGEYENWGITESMKFGPCTPLNTTCRRTHAARLQQRVTRQARAAERNGVPPKVDNEARRRVRRCSSSGHVIRCIALVGAFGLQIRATLESHQEARFSRSPKVISEWSHNPIPSRHSSAGSQATVTIMLLQHRIVIFLDSEERFMGAIYGVPVHWSRAEQRPWPCTSLASRAGLDWRR